MDIGTYYDDVINAFRLFGSGTLTYINPHSNCPPSYKEILRFLEVGKELHEAREVHAENFCSNLMRLVRLEFVSRGPPVWPIQPA